MGSSKSELAVNERLKVLLSQYQPSNSKPSFIGLAGITITESPPVFIEETSLPPLLSK